MSDIFEGVDLTETETGKDVAQNILIPILNNLGMRNILLRVCIIQKSRPM